MTVTSQHPGTENPGTLFSLAANLYLFLFLVVSRNFNFTGFLSEASVIPLILLSLLFRCFYGTPRTSTPGGQDSPSSPCSPLGLGQTQDSQFVIKLLN